MSFYVISGGVLALLRNGIIQKPNQLVLDNRLVIPVGTINSQSRRLELPTCMEPTSGLDTSTVRIYLLIVPCKATTFKKFFTREWGPPILSNELCSSKWRVDGNICQTQQFCIFRRGKVEKILCSPSVVFLYYRTKTLMSVLSSQKSATW